MCYVTNAQEIQSFINFIDKNKPYDLIIDGLNIMYLAKRNMKCNVTYEVSNFETIIV